MTDHVTYVLPISPLSDLLHPLLAKPQIAKSFAFPEKAVTELSVEPQDYI